ncbi:MAG: Imm26 family immunity protein [Pyrinomonadaceae bacterium]
MTIRIRRKIGDVIQIALPDGRFAYGRLYDDASVGIYERLTDMPNMPPIGSREFKFHVGIYDDVVTKERVQIVGHDKFIEPESEWPPPTYILDPISGEYSLYHQGVIKKASREECEGLEEAAVWDLQHIIDRIMNVN